MLEPASAGLSLSDRRAIRLQVLNLAWPVIAESFLQTLVQMVSMALVGHLGAAAVASIGLSMQPLNAIYGVFMGAGVGAAAVVARLVGSGHHREAGRASAQAMVISFALAGIAALLMFGASRSVVTWMGAEPSIVPESSRYLRVMIPGLFFMWVQTVLTGALRGAGDMRTPMKVNIIVTILNFTGNVLLVYGLFGFPALGVLGAGLATTVARVIGGTMLLIPYLAGRTILTVHFPRDFGPDAQVISRVLRIGIPSALERLIMSGSQLFYARMVAGLGTASYAAHTIGLNAESLSYMPSNGFSTAATTLVGQNLGPGRPDIAERGTYESFRMAAMFVGTMGVAFLLFPETLMRIYTTDLEVIRLGAIYLRIMAFCQVHQSAGAVFTGALRGAGDTRFVMYITGFSAWFLRLGVTYCLIFLAGTNVVGAWWGMTADTLFKAVTSVIWFRTGRWRKVSV